MAFLLFLLFYSFTNLTTHQPKETHRLGRAAEIDSTFTACASEAAIRSFAGTEVYYGKVVEYKCFVLSDSQLLVRYQLGINGEIAWVINEKTVNYPISIKTISTSQYNLINKSLILLKPMNDSIFIGRMEIRNNKCIKIPTQYKLNRLSENEEVYYLTLHFVFLRFMYGLSSGGWIPDRVFPIPDSIFNEMQKMQYHGLRNIRHEYSISQLGKSIPKIAENIHVAVKYIGTPKYHTFQRNKHYNHPFLMEIWGINHSKINPDTAIVFMPYPERYFESVTDSFNIKSVVLKYAFANNRYEIDTSGITTAIPKYVFMGYSNEIFRHNDK